MLKLIVHLILINTLRFQHHSTFVFSTYGKGENYLLTLINLGKGTITNGRIHVVVNHLFSQYCSLRFSTTENKK